MQQHFHYQALPVNVFFSAGASKQTHVILKDQGYKRVLIITTPGQESTGQLMAQQLGDLAIGVYPYAVMHVPVNVAEDAVTFVLAHQVDCCLALGGGSTIGLAKAIALKIGIAIAAIPTTYAGSEMTSVYGMTENNQKHTGKDLKVLPKVVIYDPELTLALPTEVSASSGMNAMAHAIEALYAEDKNPITSMMAIESIKALRTALPSIVKNPQSLEARTQAMYGAWLAGVCLGSVGMAIHHKLCHVLGGRFNLPHAQTHAITLPYSVFYNQNTDPTIMTTLAMALGGTHHTEAANLIYQLNQELGIPLSLHDLGLPANGPQEVAKMVCASPYFNPRPYEEAELSRLLSLAYDGLPPV